LGRRSRLWSPEGGGGGRHARCGAGRPARSTAAPDDRRRRRQDVRQPAASRARARRWPRVDRRRTAAGPRLRRPRRVPLAAGSGPRRDQVAAVLLRESRAPRRTSPLSRDEDILKKPLPLVAVVEELARIDESQAGLGLFHFPVGGNIALREQEFLPLR